MVSTGRERQMCREAFTHGRRSASLVAREMHRQTPLHAPGWPSSRGQTRVSVGENVEKSDPSSAAGGDVTS